jgi:hypothetical protein
MRSFGSLSGFPPSPTTPISADLGGSCCHLVVTSASAGSSVSSGFIGAADVLVTGSGYAVHVRPWHREGRP